MQQSGMQSCCTARPPLGKACFSCTQTSLQIILDLLFVDVHAVSHRADVRAGSPGTATYESSTRKRLLDLSCKCLLGMHAAKETRRSMGKHCHGVSPSSPRHLPTSFPTSPPPPLMPHFTFSRPLQCELFFPLTFHQICFSHLPPEVWCGCQIWDVTCQSLSTFLLCALLHVCSEESLMSRTHLSACPFSSTVEPIWLVSLQR